MHTNDVVTRTETSLLKLLLCPRVDGKAVAPGAVVRCVNAMGTDTKLIKVTKVDLTDKQISGWTVDKTTGLEYRENGKRCGTWARFAQVVAVVHEATRKTPSGKEAL